MRLFRIALVAAAGGAMSLSAAGDVMETGAMRDTTIYESPTGDLAGGASDSLYVGQTGRTANIRRGLLAFDVSSIPAGSTINSVSLRLNMAQTSSGPATLTAHRVTADWGAAGSVGGGMGAQAQPGDATWLHTFYNTETWATPGGDFVASPSASTVVDQPDFYFWSSPGMVADVQAWVDGTAGNFGWILLGDETTLQTAKRFTSSEFFLEEGRPQLVIDYTPVPAPAGVAALALAGLGVASRRRR